VIRGSIDVSDGNELGRGLATKMDGESVALLNEALGREVISRQAVIMPPLLPSAGIKWDASVLVGRKEVKRGRVGPWSLVS
jgi:hypothetical protein